MKKVILSICCVLLTQICANAANITYTEDTSDFANPERGFLRTWLSDSKSPSPLGQGFFDSLQANKSTLIRQIYNMTTFRSGPISKSYLDHIQADMDNVRKNGVKVGLHFAYTFNEPPPHNDAPLGTILSHIDQLAPLLQKNADVIAYMDAGFIGRWGEWHASSNGLANTADMRTVLFKELAVLPKSRAVLVRYLQKKKEIFNNTQALTSAEGFNQSDRARTGHINNCFVAADDDWGTYWPIDGASLNAQKDYLNAENRFVPQAGETCNLNPPRSDCPSSVADLARMRWSALNEDYHEGVLQRWKDQGCYNDIRKKLGYRFRLISANIPETAKAGAPLSFSFVIKNDGYASPYNARDLEAVLRAKSNGAVTRFKLTADPRHWLPENGNITVNANVSLPANFPLGDYDVLLNLPDPMSALNTNPAYSIRLANNPVWEAATGYNSLLHKITVGSGGTPPNLPDLIVTSLSYANGVFTSTVKNQGTVATPSGVFLLVAYSVDGVYRTYGNGGTTSLAAGASRTIGTASAADGGGPFTLPNGTHTIMAHVDDENRIAESEETNNQLSQSITVGGTDTTPPTVSITAPAGGATIDGSANVSATASDNVGVVGVQFRLDGVNLGAEDTSAPYCVPWNSASASNGSYTLTAVARDAAGNSTTSAAVTVTVNNMPSC